jgi:hypothetical protein
MRWIDQCYWFTCFEGKAERVQSFFLYTVVSRSPSAMQRKSLLKHHSKNRTAEIIEFQNEARTRCGDAYRSSGIRMANGGGVGGTPNRYSKSGNPIDNSAWFYDGETTKKNGLANAARPRVSNGFQS